MEDEEGMNLQAPEPAEESTSGAPPAEKAHVSEWLEKIAQAEKKHGPAFKQMRECMDLVAFGGRKEWVESGNYVVPVVARHINLAVAQLYAKNPKVAVSRKPRMLYTVWDEKPQTIQMVQERAVMGDMNAIMELQALQQDIQAAADYNLMADRTARTLSILWEHFLDEQTLGTKKQLKSLVRRTKTTGVGYVKMGFQREFAPTPEPDSRIQDMSQQVAHAEQLAREVSRGDVKEDDPEMAELQHTTAALQAQVPLVREGIVLSYPKSTRVIIDPACDNLKTLAGAGWLAETYYLTAREVERTYGVKVESGKAKALAAFGMESDRSKHDGALRVYEVQDKETGTFFTVCEGHDGYLARPDNPPIMLERFFTVFPLVFNEVEHETELFPASDVWRARHMQDEYNRSREGRREHRIASRPFYVTRAGVLEEQEKNRLGSHSAHEIIELQGLQDGQAVDALLQRGPAANIDPNLYEVESINGDILRTVGAQEANLGPVSGGTATESSIAESSRMSSVADNVDDLDDLLTDLARNGGQVLLAEMSKEQVIEIVGPGAVWPEAPPTRAELAKELILKIEAGSSGRPNKAADIANIERAAPFLIQLPGVSPGPLARKYAQLLDIDPDDLYQEGALSIVAVNAMAGGNAGVPTAGGPVPAAQGGQGAARSQGAPDTTGGGPQAAFTQPGEGVVQPG